MFPRVDLQVAAVFFDSANASFPVNENPVVMFFYRLFAKIHVPVLLVLLLGTAWFAYTKEKVRRTLWAFLLCSLILGPGLIVNTVLKDNSVGRPRPRQVQEFAGPHQYTPPFYYSGACQRNCSFTSGHAAIGFYFMAFGWVFRRKSVFFAGCALGAALGLMRIAQGAHFLSDVIFSFWMVYGTCVLLAHWFGVAKHGIIEAGGKSKS